jgi:hypothetical protein
VSLSIRSRDLSLVDLLQFKLRGNVLGNAEVQSSGIGQRINIDRLERRIARILQRDPGEGITHDD